MGYYVRIEETASNFKIKKENFERGYEIVCDLNRHDYLKHGGKFGGDPTPKPADSKSCAGNPDVWFSWMPWNYDELCGNLVEVLEMVGFGVEFDDAGNISGLSYDDKTGCEETFLNALKPVIEEGSYLTWVGEEGGEWFSSLSRKGRPITAALLCIGDADFWSSPLARTGGEFPTNPTAL